MQEFKNSITDTPTKREYDHPLNLILRNMVDKRASAFIPRYDKYEMLEQIDLKQVKMFFEPYSKSAPFDALHLPIKFAGSFHGDPTSKQLMCVYKEMSGFEEPRIQ